MGFVRSLLENPNSVSISRNRQHTYLFVKSMPRTKLKMLKMIIHLGDTFPPPVRLFFMFSSSRVNLEREIEAWKVVVFLKYTYMRNGET